jgi:hypothetical protein
MSRVGFEPTIPAFDHAATVVALTIYIRSKLSQLGSSSELHFVFAVANILNLAEDHLSCLIGIYAEQTVGMGGKWN